ncbi:hypothetical protein ACLSU7_14040 [Bdellovibrio sp. HCB185ZH]|uniref:hypothetical protein n=1 Tax=Bdellovibrio sp. HCB185ZH TaxID=3394235 RepID=UPI0039A73338
MGHIFVVSLIFFMFSASQAATVTVTSGTKSPSDFTASDDVVINGNVSFSSGTYNINSLTINTTRTLTALSDVSAGTGVIINATTSVTVTGTFSANLQGYGSVAGNTFGGPGLPSVNGMGAAHGGLGGRNKVLAGYMALVYGNALEPMSLGSSGVNTTGFPGGGAIKIKSPALSLTGTISAIGSQGYGSPGGSSGGSIFLDVDSITGSGTLNVSGGGANGGDGAGGGRIGILSNTLFSGTVDVSGGNGAGVDGDPGTFIFRYKSSPNDIYCNKSIASSSSGIMLASDLPSTLNNLNLSSNCRVAIYGDVFAGGNISVTGGATLAVVGNRTTGIGSTLAANNITVDAASEITASGRGFGSDGPGSGIMQYPGASHGGAGGLGDSGSSTSPSQAIYGNAYQPVQLGSGGYTETYGGGAIRILVVGQLQLNGAITADGTSSSSGGNGGASGGSLLIYSGSFIGSGAVSVNGGNGSGYSSSGGGGGGGGRIAFLIAGTNSFTGTMIATGGASGVGSSGPNNATAGANGTIVNFSPGVATKLAVTTQPSTYARKDVSFSGQPVFAAVDANGYMVPTYSTAITVAVYSNATCTTAASGTLQGTFQNVAGLGMGRGVDLRYDTLGTVYIKASSGSLTSVCTSKIMVGSVGTKLVLTTQPSTTATAGWDFGRIPKVAVQDASGSGLCVFRRSCRFCLLRCNLYNDDSRWESSDGRNFIFWPFFSNGWSDDLGLFVLFTGNDSLFKVFRKWFNQRLQ